MILATTALLLLLLPLAQPTEAAISCLEGMQCDGSLVAFLSATPGEEGCVSRVLDCSGPAPSSLCAAFRCKTTFRLHGAIPAEAEAEAALKRALPDSVTW